MMAMETGHKKTARFIPLQVFGCVVAAGFASFLSSLLDVRAKVRKERRNRNFGTDARLLI